MAPTSAVTALLYYFGWTRTMVEAHLLGLDESILGYSTRDYLLRSISSMYTPIVVGLTTTLAAIALHGAIVAWAGRLGLPLAVDVEDRTGWRRVRRVVWGVAALGVVCLVLGYGGTRAHEPSRALYIAAPIGVTVGILLVVYSASLFRQFLLRPHSEPPASRLAGLDGIANACIVMLVLISLFWNVSHYAVVKGNELADEVLAILPRQPGVILYSAKRLYLQAPVVETRLDPENAAYNYAYTGLTLLFRTDGKYFLRPSATTARLNIVIPDSLDVRLELFHP